MVPEWHSQSVESETRREKTMLNGATNFLKPYYVIHTYRYIYVDARSRQYPAIELYAVADLRPRS